VIVREAVLNNPEVARLLSERFVPIALDNVDHPNLTSGERRFLEGKGLEACTQGMSVFTAGGKVLARGGGFEADGVSRMLRRALAEYRPEEPPPDGKLEAGAPDGEKEPKILRPPAGGLVLHVTWKTLGGCDKPESSATTGSGRYDREFQHALGVDRLWVRADEAGALAAGSFPVSLKRRMARHLDYVLAGKVEELEITLHDGRASGACRLSGGEEARLLGCVEAENGKVTRFELAVKGNAERVEDFGFAAGLTVVPCGARVPAGILFRLAPADDQLARVPPYRASDPSYLR
jgi:hypothetical protein